MQTAACTARSAAVPCPTGRSPSQSGLQLQGRPKRRWIGCSPQSAGSISRPLTSRCDLRSASGNGPSPAGAVRGTRRSTAARTVTTPTHRTTVTAKHLHPRRQLPFGQVLHHVDVPLARAICEMTACSSATEPQVGRPRATRTGWPPPGRCRCARAAGPAGRGPARSPAGPARAA